MNVGARITELRTQKNWTTNYLANRCGLSQSFIRSVELSEKGISVEKLELICEALDISLQAFFALPTEQDSVHAALLRRVNQLSAKQQEALLKLLEQFS